jgi:hypothetical protein
MEGQMSELTIEEEILNGIRFLDGTPSPFAEPVNNPIRMVEDG